MPPPFDQAWLRVVHGGMKTAAGQMRLPFKATAWRGLAGNWLGTGIGSSIDFQDHRPYLPGDDPRYIDWNAYARSGNYTMKLYREEVSPFVDLALDLSASMFFEPSKARRTLELFYFCMESALQSDASLRCFGLSGGRAEALPVEALLGDVDLFAAQTGAGPPNLREVRWRPGSLRVLITDLLFPEPPEPLGFSLTASKGRGIVFAPFSAAESEPDWDGNMELMDSESLGKRIQHIDPESLSRYHGAYRRHFDLWQEHFRRHAAVLARVSSGPEFKIALETEAFRKGAIEMQ